LPPRARHPAQTLNRRPVTSGYSYAFGFCRAQPPIGYYRAESSALLNWTRAR
jgi:hypothetical protein